MKNNNKNYSEIVEKRRATIEKKREKTVAKKQAILEKLNNDIDYLNKVKSAVEKRKDTISKKEFIKIFSMLVLHTVKKKKRDMKLKQHKLNASVKNMRRVKH